MCGPSTFHGCLGEESATAVWQSCIMIAFEPASNCFSSAARKASSGRAEGNISTCVAASFYKKNKVELADLRRQAFGRCIQQIKARVLPPGAL